MKKLILIVSLLIPHIGFAQDAGADAREALRDLVVARSSRTSQTVLEAVYRR